MSEPEVALADIGELTTSGQVASNTRKDIEERLGEHIVTKDNLLDYQYIEDFIEFEKR